MKANRRRPVVRSPRARAAAEETPLTISTERVWRDLSEALHGFFLRRTRDETLADDLLQETFLRIHRGLPTLENDQRLAAWVYRIAHRALADQFRRPSVELPCDGSVEPATAAEEPTLEHALGACLRRMLADLPPSYREALALADLAGMDQATVAAQLGISVSGAKSRVQRGREKLKALFLACCQLEYDRRGGYAGWRRRGACCSATPNEASDASHWRA